jgi:hypothetical protein
MQILLAILLSILMTFTCLYSHKDLRIERSIRLLCLLAIWLIAISLGRLMGR